MNQQENFLHPEQTINLFHIEKGSFVAELGSGHGYFTIPLARATGPEGKVYAIDVQKNALDVIRRKAKLEHLLNVQTIWSDIERENGSRLKEGTVSAALAANILFQLDCQSTLHPMFYAIVLLLIYWLIALTCE